MLHGRDDEGHSRSQDVVSLTEGERFIGVPVHGKANHTAKDSGVNRRRYIPSSGETRRLLYATHNAISRYH